MKHSTLLLSVLSTAALFILAVGCATTTTHSPDLLAAAGFKSYPADTPKKQALLKTLPPDQLSLITWKGKTFYVQPDQPNNRALVGTPAEYQAYQQARLAKQMSNENLLAAQMDQDALDNWGGIWGPGMYGGFYGGGRFR